MEVLETKLNVRLFKRAGKQAALTEAGEILLLYSQKIIES